jgi:L-lactate dehydrogenase complex protein LldG
VVAGAVSERARLLAAVRNALRDVPADERPDDVAVPRSYRSAGALDAEARLALFAERVADYRAGVHRVAPGDVVETVVGILRAEGAATAVVAPGLAAEWSSCPPGLTVDDGSIGTAGLESSAAVTGCVVAIAETGTLVLDGSPRCGRRVVSLLPDLHVCVVATGQVVETVPEALALVDPRRGPVTLVSGPSATSDIELSRVEGVHGPRRLHVVLTG